MDSKKRNILKRRIRQAASLTPHQAGKVTGAVIDVLGIDDIAKYTNRSPENCGKAMHCKDSPYCAGCLKFVQIDNLSESHGPTQKETVLKKHNDFFAQDTDSKKIIRNLDMPAGKAAIKKLLSTPQPKRKPENCAKACTGVLCEGCPDWAQIKSDIELKDDELLPFELEEAKTAQDDTDVEEIIVVKPGSVILTPEEFKLIKPSLIGSMSSSINDSINKLQKKMDKDDEKQVIIEGILTILKLKNKLDKL